MPERDRKIALFDIDGTAYDGFLVFPLAEIQARDGIIDPQVSARMNELRDKSEKRIMPYPQMVKEVVEIWAEGLRGKSADEVLRHTESYLRGEGNNFFPYVGKVIGSIKDTHDVFFITGGTQFTAEATSRIYNATGYVSTQFEVEDGLFTGRVTSMLSVGEHKLEALRELMKKHDREKSLAFGDAESDLDMLDAIEYAICINPKPVLKAYAQEKGWPIFYSDRAPSVDEIPEYVSDKLR